MNLTEQEKGLLAAVALRLHEQGVPFASWKSDGGGEESFFRSPDELKLFGQTLFEYGFETPAELRAMLEDMWNFQGNPGMAAFAPACVVAAFKLCEQPGGERNGRMVSAYLYEF